MAVPYRKQPKSAVSSTAAFLEVVWLPSARTFYGGLLIIDAKGQPIEFVFNTVEAPVGFLWPEEQVRSMGIASLCHSLFDSCQAEPELLVCRESLGRPEYCKSEIAVAIPFAQVSEPGIGAPIAWSWINEAPPAGMNAYLLAESLRERGFAIEPFVRIRLGLKEAFPEAPWLEASDDRV